MISDWIDYGLEVGDTMRLIDDGIYGEVTDIVLDDMGDPAAAVLRLLDEPGFATVDLSKCSPDPAPKMI